MRNPYMKFQNCILINCGWTHGKTEGRTNEPKAICPPLQLFQSLGHNNKGLQIYVIPLYYWMFWTNRGNEIKMKTSIFCHSEYVQCSYGHHFILLYNWVKRPIFIGLERSCGQSTYCHIHWLARACQWILVTKIRLLVFFLFRFCFSKASLIILS